MSAIALSVGARFTFETVTWKGLVSLSEPSLAEAEAAYVPASVKPGARWMLPVVAFVVVTVRNEGPPAFVNVSASPSGSEPVTA